MRAEKLTVVPQRRDLELEGDRSAERIFRSIDALKLRSSMTPVFRLVLDRYFDGAPDRGRTSCSRPS